MSRHDRPLDELLTLLAGAPIVNDTQRAALLEAVVAVRDIFFAGQAECPRVLITAGYHADPVVVRFEDLSHDLTEMRGRLADVESNVDDILRLLLERRNDTRTTTTTGADT